MLHLHRQRWRKDGKGSAEVGKTRRISVATTMFAVWWVVRRRGWSSVNSALSINGKETEGYVTVDS